MVLVLQRFRSQQEGRRLLLAALLFLRQCSKAAASENEVNVAMVPKFDGLVPFEQAKTGAYMAYRELGSRGLLEYVAPPTAEGSGAKQVDIIHSATGTGFDAILLSNNADNDIAEAAVAATEAGLDIVTFDSPIPSGVEGGEQLFVSQVDFDEAGKVMADMALQILPNGGSFAILSASRKAANQNAWNEAMLSSMASDPDRYGKIKLLEIVYGDDSDAVSYERANYLMDRYPDIGLIMSPTTIGIAAAARALTDRGSCATVKVSGLGLPAEMVDYTLSGCAPVFALWDFVDLGYLSYYAAFRLVTGAFTVEPGATFSAGRLGTFTVERDPTRPNIAAYRVIMGDFTKFDKTNVEDAVFFDAIQGDGGQESFEQRFIDKYKKKAIAIIPKVTGMISFVFSAYIVWSVLSKPRRRRLTKMRLLVGISIHDMIAAFFGFFLSTWPIPEDTWLVYGNVGTTQTCAMQGFFFQAGIGATPLYSAALTTFYLLNVVFKLPTDRIVKAEPFLHGIPIAFGWGTAIAGIPLTLYNAADRVGFMCWIAEFPAYCSLRDSCQRGDNAVIYRWAFLYAWVFAVFVYMAVCMTWIHHVVLSSERATDRWTQAAHQRRKRNLSRNVAVSGLRYVVAFIFPWIFAITVSIMRNQAYGDISASARLSDAMTALEIVNAVIWPLKGFFTFLAYMRPSRSTRRARHTASTGESSNTGENSAEVRGIRRIIPPASFQSWGTRSELSREQ
jgi:rhamnose transport system substrate-binding protein